MRVLLSIKPQFAEKIFSGSKRFEFRKRVHKNALVNTVVVYVTKPVGKVVGEFSIRQIHAGSPRGLWRKTKTYSGIGAPEFDQYFEGRRLGFAIEVDQAKLYRTPLDLQDVLPTGCAPQSFAYITGKTRQKEIGIRRPLV